MQVTSASREVHAIPPRRHVSPARRLGVDDVALTRVPVLDGVPVVRITIEPERVPLQTTVEGEVSAHATPAPTRKDGGLVADSATAGVAKASSTIRRRRGIQVVNGVHPCSGTPSAKCT